MTTCKHTHPGGDSLEVNVDEEILTNGERVTLGDHTKSKSTQFFFIFYNDFYAVSLLKDWCGARLLQIRGCTTVT